MQDIEIWIADISRIENIMLSASNNEVAITLGYYFLGEEYKHLNNNELYRHYIPRPIQKMVEVKDYYGAYQSYINKLKDTFINLNTFALNLETTLKRLGAIEPKKVFLASETSTDGFSYGLCFYDLLLSLGAKVRLFELDYQTFRNLVSLDSFKQININPFSEIELEEILESNNWIFAKTMADNPHFYTLRKTWKNDQLFTKAYLSIRLLGKYEYFGGILYRMFYGKTHKYWTMYDAQHFNGDSPYLADNIVLINKKKLPCVDE